MTIQITELAPTLERVAYKFTSTDEDAADFLQDAMLGLVEFTQSDPNALSNSRTYLVNRGKWAGQQAADKHRTMENTRSTSLDGPGVTFAELLPAGTLDPQEAAEQAETIEELLSMTDDIPDGPKMVKLIYLGYSEKEIAETLHVSAAAISQRKHKLIARWRNLQI
jgi:RNA polymerase sigma factor (sigma-70 family)